MVGGCHLCLLCGSRRGGGVPRLGGLSPPFAVGGGTPEHEGSDTRQQEKEPCLVPWALVFRFCELFIFPLSFLFHRDTF